MSDVTPPSRAKRGVRVVAAVVVLVGIAVGVLKLSYTDVPQERLAVAEMIALAGASTTRIAEAFQAWDTLEGRLDGLLPPAGADQPSSKGPFEWQLGLDGTLRGRSARYGVTVEFATKDQGLNWTCRVDPPVFAPRVGRCATTE